MIALNIKFHKAKGNSRVIKEVNLSGAMLPMVFVEGMSFELDNPKIKGTVGKVRTIYDSYNRSWQLIVNVNDCGDLTE